MKISHDAEAGQNIRLPAEWEPHAATWLSWPNRTGQSYYGKLEPIFPALHAFIETLARGEDVYINISDPVAREEVLSGISQSAAEKVTFFEIETNEPWCRDHAPTFLIDGDRLSAVCWVFNGWGERWGSLGLDAAAGRAMAGALDLPITESPLVCEGGAIDSNGQGFLMVTESALLDLDRNPKWNREQTEEELVARLDLEDVIWLEGGELEGDDTSGHIDTLARFVAPNRVVAGFRAGHPLMEKVVEELECFRSAVGQPLEVVRLPVPSFYEIKGDKVPATYCNFYIGNAAVIVPSFGVEEDSVAEEIFRAEFPDREVVMIDSREIIYGLGSFHCLSHQVPAVGVPIELRDAQRPFFQRR